MRIAAAALAAMLLPAASRAGDFAPAAREFGRALGSAGVRTISFVGIKGGAPAEEAELRRALSAQPGIALASRGSARALVAARLIEHGAGRRLLLRAIDSESGVILAASETLLEDALAPGRAAETREYRELLVRARALLNRGSGALALGAELQSGDPELRAAAALAMGLGGAADGGRGLRWTLRADPDWRVRHAAALALGRVRTPEARQALALAQRRDPDPSVRWQADRSLNASARALN